MTPERLDAFVARIRGEVREAEEALAAGGDSPAPGGLALVVAAGKRVLALHEDYLLAGRDPAMLPGLMAAAGSLSRAASAARSTPKGR